LIVSDKLRVALKILDIFSQNKALRSFSIVKIDIENPSKISFYLSDQLEIVIDNENIPKRIDTLGVILVRAKLDWERIRYIDLRFEEPVIKYDE
ncbi:MAG: cell division protein FtsQ/DivIB, partial [Candidatus Omnitrophica bacterium]|nr:cell division protein FtsQ/DivIB [Candidatus Omnitrophota bacterium]